MTRSVSQFGGNCLFILGAALFVFGFWSWSHAAGYIVGGLVLGIIGFLGGLGALRSLRATDPWD